MLEMTRRQYIPAVVAYTKDLADTINAVEQTGADASVQKRILNELTGHLKEADSALTDLESIMKGYDKTEEGRARAVYCRDVIVPAMNALRAPVDEMELLVDKSKWPVPTYGDLLFRV